MEWHPRNEPAGADSMPQRLSDANSAAMVELHSEQRSLSSEQFVPADESDQEDTKMETSLLFL